MYFRMSWVNAVFYHPVQNNYCLFLSHEKGNFPHIAFSLFETYQLMYSSAQTLTPLFTQTFVLCTGQSFPIAHLIRDEFINSYLLSMEVRHLLFNVYKKVRIVTMFHCENIILFMMQNSPAFKPKKNLSRLLEHIQCHLFQFLFDYHFYNHF